jgi:2-isopropylmalate synthase
VKTRRHPAVALYDCTLRDGTQGEGVTFSVEEKLDLARKLDAFGMHYIEGGWPHPASPKEVAFFKAARSLHLKRAKLTAFGSTRRARVKAERDESLRALLDARTSAVAIFGKSWDYHVTDVLRTTLDENLAMIRESVRVLKRAGKEVIYDAEHFFDGFKRNPAYATASILAAQEAGADWLVLCDTNGGLLPFEVAEIVRNVKNRFTKPFGIHVHNDTECGVANSLTAIQLGASQVHGTINGFGERCGNANLVSILANLKLKLGVDCVSDASLKGLRGLSLYVSELATKPPRDEAPYVGASAFAHKAGVHADAMAKAEHAYEHITPDIVGNRRRILVSDMSGGATVRWKAGDYGFKFEKGGEASRKVLTALKQKEADGYHYEGAEASFELLVHRITRNLKAPFELVEYRVAVVNQAANGGSVSEATLKVRVKGETEHTVAEGDGPVNALDSALRKALGRFYPAIRNLHLVDYRVRVINPAAATAAKVRVTIESTDGADTWSTVGVSENIIEASWQALADSVEYKLLKSKKR